MATSHRARLVRPTPTDGFGPLPPHAAVRQHGAWLWLERALFLTGLVSLSYLAYVAVEAALYQAYERRELDAILRTPDVALGPNRQPSVARRSPAAGTSLGRIDIPRLGVSAIVRTGADARTLNLAVGHIPGTALPGDPGNVGLAGHRDTFFRRLRNIRSNDEIRVVTPEGTHVYTVERTLVVNPEDVWVLDSDGEAVLTLVTCYPFTYIGSAPQRFIVRARLTAAATGLRQPRRIDDAG